MPKVPSELPSQHLELHKASFTHPAIDNHAHPLLDPQHRSEFPFEGLVSEAQDLALQDAIHTLACYRATAQLGKLFSLDATPVSKVTWDQVKRHRDTLDYSELCETCFAPTYIQCILLDDGLNRVEELAWDCRQHDFLTLSPTKRIVRIEKLAENILAQYFDTRTTDECGEFLPHFMRSFTSELYQLAESNDVVAFKSVVCYRTGLDVSISSEEDIADSDIAKLYYTYNLQRTVRIQHKALNDLLVQTALEIAAEVQKPVQFHTGLGDNDINLVTSSPAHLQNIIEAFPDSKIVLLHASYPFTREAAYLASAYKNVYLDFGEIFPLISGDGQREVVRQILELCPTNKIMWSSDGHWWPESYYLGAIQARQALYEVLARSVDRDELSEQQAVTIVQNALFYNANKLYDLNLQAL